MRGGPAWRLCLFAFLLSMGRAEDSSRAHDQSDEINLEELWKSGAPNDNDGESAETIDGQSIPSAGNFYLGPVDENRKSYHEQYSSYNDLVNNYPYQEQSINNNGHIYSENNENRLPSNTLELQNRQGNKPMNDMNSLQRIYEQNPSLLRDNQDLLAYDAAVKSRENLRQQELLRNLFNSALYRQDSSAPVEGEIQDDVNPNPDQYLQRPFQPVVVLENNHHDTEGSLDINLSAHASLEGLISKLVPVENLIQLHDLPGGKYALNCSSSGEIYHFMYGAQCLVCVCLKESLFKAVKPVCVSCNGCSAPVPEPHYIPPNPFEPVTRTPDTQGSCKPLSTNKPFQSPLDPCKVCICTETFNIWGKKEATIQCERNPECVIPPDGTTVSPSPDAPIPVNVCDKLPQNVLFPHPRDACKLCQCTILTNRGQSQLQISCRTNPECLPSPEPIVTLAPDTPQPAPATCSPIPSGLPFQNPLNPCQICLCTETLDPFGRPDVFIKCDESPECVLPPDVPVIPPDVKPVPLSICSRMPQDVPFPHPRDSCKICKCTVQVTPVGPREFISCYTNPECELSPLEPSICDRYPPNALFPDPRDECRVCRCIVQQTLYGQTERHINCYIKPECSGSTVTPVTVRPSPEREVTCAPLPTGRPFENPLHPCQVCVCREVQGPAGPDVNIQCWENPQCVTPLDVTTVPPIPPNTPVPLPSCAKFPKDVVFPHPREVCRLCKCSVQVTPYGVPREYITCFDNPDCEPTQEPHTVAPLDPTEPLTCKPLPSGKPFQNPLNPCEICVCIESLNPYGRPNVRIECRANSQCVVPPEIVTAVPIIPDNEPVPLPMCVKFPQNVVFPHPREACRLCKCTVKVTPYGVPSEYITCFSNPACEPTEEIVTLAPPEPALTCKPLPSGKPFQNPLNPCEICVCIESLNAYGKPTVRIECKENPQCVIPPDTTTVPIIPDNKPIPLPICAKFPPNVVFPHPREACRLCKCNVQVTPYGVPREYITCFINPQCAPTPAPSPWPPAPPGPLPGPSPHESCSPYAPNKPFQHPWDECQVCVCSEATSIGHTTIEVNCFTKKSCCIETPFDLSELPSSSTGPYIVHPKLRSDISGLVDGNTEVSIAYGADGQRVNLKEILDPNNIGHYLKPTNNFGPIVSGHKQINRPGGGSIYTQDSYERESLIANEVMHRGPVKYVTNPAQNGQLIDIDNIDLYGNKPIESDDSGYRQLRIPEYRYSDNGNLNYQIPFDLRNTQLQQGNNKYISSVNGQVVIPGYSDQRYVYHGNVPIATGSGHVNPFIMSSDDGQEYNIASHENIRPGELLNGQTYLNEPIEVDLSGAGSSIQIRPNSYTNQYISSLSPHSEFSQNNLQTIQSPWLQSSSYGSYPNIVAANLRGTGKMRTKSGRPSDSNQSESEESSGTVE